MPEPPKEPEREKDYVDEFEEQMERRPFQRDIDGLKAKYRFWVEKTECTDSFDNVIIFLSDNGILINSRLKLVAREKLKV